MTNQILPPIPAGPALGAPAQVDFAAVPGDQFVTIARPLAAGPVATFADGGQTLELRADLIHTDAAAAQWMKDGVVLTNNDFVAGADTPVLRIRPFLPADRGLYEVVVTGPCGSFVGGLDVNARENDECSGATALGVGTHFMTLLGATASTLDRVCATAEPDMWYEFTADAAGVLRVDTCGSHDFTAPEQGVNTVLGIHMACSEPPVACGGSAGGCSGADTGNIADAAEQRTLAAGERVLIRVATEGENHPLPGLIVLNVSFTPACIADRDGNGSVDVFDLLAYLDLWFSGDAAAEFTGDDPAIINVFDLLTYLDLWFAGCD